MGLINPPRSSGPSLVHRVPGEGCEALEAGSARRRSLSNPNTPARRHERPRDTIGSRWKLAKGLTISGSRPAFSPKPPPPAGECPDDSRRPSEGSVAASSTKTQYRKLLTEAELPLSTGRRKQSPFVPPRQGTLSTTLRPEIHPAPNIERGENTDGVVRNAGLRKLLPDGFTGNPPELLPRSGSAPSSSALAQVTNLLSATCVLAGNLADSRPVVLGEETSGAWDKVARTTRSCWDESKDGAVALLNVATTRQPGSGSTTASTEARATAVSESKHEQQVPDRYPTSSGGRKSSQSGTQQELVGNGEDRQRQRLVPLRRRTSSMGGVGPDKVKSKRGIAHSKAVSTRDESILTKRRNSISGLRPPDTKKSISSSTSMTRAGASPGRVSRSSDTGAGREVDQDHLKARIRVMEWKKRRAEVVKTQQEEQGSLQKIRQAQTDAEAARKLAATRAEEAGRRLVAERKSLADAARAAEAAEEWAKVSRQKERRRAEIYAINAVMRAASEREFKAYSLEQERRAARAAASVRQDPALTEIESHRKQ